MLLLLYVGDGGVFLPADDGQVHSYYSIRGSYGHNWDAITYLVRLLCLLGPAVCMCCVMETCRLMMSWRGAFEGSPKMREKRVNRVAWWLVACLTDSEEEGRPV